MRWTDKDDRTWKLSEMSDSHLINVLNLLNNNQGKIKRRGGGTSPDDYWYDETIIDNSEMIDAIELELRIRKLEIKHDKE